MTNSNKAVAEKLKQLLIDSSPLIEEFTSAVCPDCTDVCCKQKHGLYRERDAWYLEGLGVSDPRRDETRPLEGPCEAMGGQGCRQERWMRPFKCTWYFCEPLLASLNKCPPKKARQLSNLLQEMADLYAALDKE